MRTIDADALIEDCQKYLKTLNPDKDTSEYARIKWLIGVLNNVPTIEPERKKGKWTKDCACEICGFKPWYERDIHTLSFCPNCGADMRGDEHD